VRVATGKSLKTILIGLVVYSTVTPIEAEGWFLGDMHELSRHMPGPTSYKTR
jgi:hypothetical protein